MRLRFGVNVSAILVVLAITGGLYLWSANGDAWKNFIVIGVVSLALICFRDALGGFTGYVGRGGNIDQESPGLLVALLGWIWLIGGALWMVCGS